MGAMLGRVLRNEEESAKGKKSGCSRGNKAMGIQDMRIWERCKVAEAGSGLTVNICDACCPSACAWLCLASSPGGTLVPNGAEGLGSALCLVAGDKA